MVDINYYNSLKIFIASPNDVKRERKIADEVILSVDRVCRSTIGLRAECLRWEDLPPLTPLPEDGRIQDVINRDQIQKCNVFVLILNKRYGSVDPGNDISHTEQEVEEVLRIIEKGRNITLLSYFREISINPDPGDQENKVAELKKNLEKRGLLYQTFKNPDDFRQKFTHDLYYVSIRFQMAVTKQRSLRALWDLGSIQDQGGPKLAMIYPPLDRHSMKTQVPDHIWLERLVPNVVFEDFKAISKIEKSLRLIGLHQISTYTTVSFPHDVYDMNRVWLCLPRNNPGKRQMTTHSAEAWFDFVPRSENQEGYILWKPPKSHDYIKIDSPLTKYIEYQRKNIPGGEWTPNHGRIIAKDYAIIARFSDKREYHLKDYFIAGIRGLGTWGAGWFIDRRYKTFLQWENQEDEPIQILLEVTYKNEHIDDVRDVSNCPSSYFENENRSEVIETHIKKLQDF